MPNASDFVIQVKTEMLEHTAEDVENRIGDLEKALNAIEEQVLGSSRYWSGAGNEKHIGVYKRRTETIHKILAHFRDHVANLRSIAGIYTQAETNAIETNQSLSVDEIV